MVEIAALEVPVTYFFDGLDGAHEGGGKDDDLLIDSNGAALLRAFNRISDEAVQRALISLAQAVSASPADGAQAADAGEASPQASGANDGEPGGERFGAFGMVALAPTLHL